MEIKAVGIWKIIEVKEDNGHRRTIEPNRDISNEPQEIKDLANQHWTQQLKDDWQTLLNNERSVNPDE